MIVADGIVILSTEPLSIRGFRVPVRFGQN